MHARRHAIDRLPSRAIFTRPAIHSLTSDSSQPTARGPSGTGFGNTPSLMYSPAASGRPLPSVRLTPRCVTSTTCLREVYCGKRMRAGAVPATSWTICRS